MEIICLDLHQRERPLSIEADVRSITDRRLATHRDRFTAVLGGRPPARILLEVSREGLAWGRQLQRRRLFAAIACSAFACSGSSGSNAPRGPSALAGLWTSHQAPITGGAVAINAVIAVTGGALNGSGTLTVF